MKDDKYIVIKRDTFRNIMDGYHYTNNVGFHTLAQLERHALDDAVVIRTKDRFAEAGLHAYASAMLIAIDIFGEDSENAAKLVEIADYFTQRAYEAHLGPKEMPT